MASRRQGAPRSTARIAPKPETRCGRILRAPAADRRPDGST